MNIVFILLSILLVLGFLGGIVFSIYRLIKVSGSNGTVTTAQPAANAAQANPAQKREKFMKWGATIGLVAAFVIWPFYLSTLSPYLGEVVKANFKTQFFLGYYGFGLAMALLNINRPPNNAWKWVAASYVIPFIILLINGYIYLTFGPEDNFLGWEEAIVVAESAHHEPVKSATDQWRTVQGDTGYLCAVSPGQVIHIENDHEVICFVEITGRGVGKFTGKNIKINVTNNGQLRFIVNAGSSIKYRVTG